MSQFLNAILRTGGLILAGHVAGRIIGRTEEEKKKLSKKLRIAGGIGGAGYSILTYKSQNTVNYTLKNRGKNVYEGITYEERVHTRIREHIADGKRFDDFSTSSPRTREKALIIEKARIQRKNPKYNNHHNS